MANKGTAAIAVKVVALDDHIAEVDGATQFDAVVRRDTRVSLGHRLLNVDRAAHRIDDAGNSTSRPSPVVLTIRPWCSAIVGSRSSRRSA